MLAGQYLEVGIEMGKNGSLSFRVDAEVEEYAVALDGTIVFVSDALRAISEKQQQNVHP